MNRTNRSLAKAGGGANRKVVRQPAKGIEVERADPFDLDLNRCIDGTPDHGLRHCRLGARRPHRLRCGAATRGHAIATLAFDLLRGERQCELLAHHPGQETAHRMLLPARRLHDRCDGCTVGLPEQCRHRLLLAAGAGRVYRGRLRLLARGAALLATHRLAWFGIFLCDITGSSLVMTVNLPSPPKPRSGECDGGAGYSEPVQSCPDPNSNAPFAQERQSFPRSSCCGIRATA